MKDRYLLEVPYYKVDPKSFSRAEAIIDALTLDEDNTPGVHRSPEERIEHLVEKLSEFLAEYARLFPLAEMALHRSILAQYTHVEEK